GLAAGGGGRGSSRACRVGRDGARRSLRGGAAAGRRWRRGGCRGEHQPGHSLPLFMGVGADDSWWGRAMSGLPSGAVTFVFTDIEGSTRLVKALRDRYPPVLAEHRRLVRAAIAAQAGHEVDTQGDAFFVAF